MAALRIENGEFEPKSFRAFMYFYSKGLVPLPRSMAWRAYKAFRSGDPSYHFNLMCRLSQWTAMAVGLQALCVLVVFCIVIEGLKV